MKIQTQFHWLIAGILIVPVLLAAAQAVYRNTVEDREAAAEYRELTDLLDEEMNFEDRELFFHWIYRLSRMGEIAIFRSDFQVVHSTVPGITAGEFESAQTIIALITGEGRMPGYSFESPSWMNNRGYVLIHRDKSLPRKYPLGGVFYPVIALLALIFFVTAFAIIMSLIIARSITTSVKALENATRRIAAGDLDFAVDVKGSNEITSLTRSLNKVRNALREAERRRYRFIMGISHDLKTPLALIKAYNEAIEDGITEDPATGTAATEIIAAKVDQLEGMIGDLIEFVRMDTGEWRGRLTPMPVAAFLRQSAQAFTQDAELLRHEFLFNIALPGDLTAPMDERLVQRALVNIVHNAIRYTPDGSVIRMDAALAGTAIRLRVSDNGPGIDEADLPHIFEMFYRGSSSRREQGMGLGLAVAKWVIDCHGWNIAAAGDNGPGVCFTITIPLGDNHDM